MSRARETDVTCCLQAQALIKRTYLLKDIGIEIFFSGRNSLYLTFKTSADRDRIAGMHALQVFIILAHQTFCAFLCSKPYYATSLQNVTFPSAAGLS